MTTTLSLVIKGNRDAAFKAMKARGLDGRFLHEVKGTSVCEVTLADDMPVVLWYTEAHGKVMPEGTLLLYTRVDNPRQVA